MKPNTDISNAEKGNQEGSKGCGKGEELPVSLEDLEVICQACDDCLHATHLVDTNREKVTQEICTHRVSFKCSLMDRVNLPRLLFEDFSQFSMHAHFSTSVFCIL